MAGNPDRDHRGDEGSGRLSEAARNRFGTNRIRSDQAIWAVLLCRTNRHDDALRAREVRFHLGPSLKPKLHFYLSVVWAGAAVPAGVVTACRNRTRPRAGAADPRNTQPGRTPARRERQRRPPPPPWSGCSRSGG